MSVLEKTPVEDLVAPRDSFPRRHLGPSEADVLAMLKALDLPSLEALPKVLERNGNGHRH